LEARRRDPDAPLAAHGLSAVRRESAARRIPPAPASDGTYSASEMATAHAMLQKLQHGRDQRPAKILSVLQALAEEDYESARRMEIVIDRLLDDLKG
jgi:hypothetical protein